MVGSTASNVVTASARRPRAKPRRPTPTRELLSEPTDESRSRLNGAKLEALVRARTDDEISASAAFGAGAALLAGSTAWVLVAGDASGSLGPALAWSFRQGTAELTVVCGDGAATAARRSALFDPAPRILSLDGAALEDVVAAPLAEIEASPDDPAMAAQLETAGLDVIVEHGMLLGELRGLELARIEHGDRGPVLHLGVGRLDREMTAMVHEDLPRPQALTRIVEIVEAERRADRPPHPLRDLAPERWLRTVIVADPAAIGCADLAPVPSPFARMNLLERSTAAAVGHDDQGRPVTVVTSVGIDLDLVPTAADTRAHLDPSSRLLVVVPERDEHPVTTALAARVEAGCEIRTVPTNWRGR